MKIHSINERMPYTATLHQLSSENNKKVRRFHLGHVMFTLQLHSWEVEDFDKKSICQQERLLKEKLPKKIRESLATPNHEYDSKLTAELAASADKIHEQLEKLQKMRDDVLAARAEAEAEAAKAKAEAAAKAADEAKAAAEAAALSKMIDEMLAARGVPAAQPANGQQTTPPDGTPADSTPADATGNTTPTANDQLETKVAKLAAEARALNAELDELRKKGANMSKEDRRRQADLLDQVTKLGVKMAELIPVAGTPATVFK